MEAPRKRDDKWLWTFVPINAAIGGFSTLLPLFILELGGTVIDVSNIVSAYSLALIPSSILWGIAVDKKATRKPFITYCYLGITGLLVAGFFIADLGAVLPLYVGYALVSTAASPAVNLILIESTSKKELSMSFAKFSSLTFVGLAAGVIPGTLWTLFLPLRAYFLLCAALAGVSVLLAARYVVEPEFVLERRIVALSQESLVAKLRTVSMIFITIPSLDDIRSFWKLMRSVLTRHLPLLYFSFFLFYSASGLFFTSYTPFLKSLRMDDSGVFTVFSTLFVLQAIIYPFTGRACTRFGESRVALASLWLRTFGFLAVTAIALLTLAGSRLLVGSVLSIAALGTAYAFYNTSSSVLLFRSLAAGKQGELLGVYSALIGIASFGGAIASGYLSFRFGYAVTFLATTIFVIGCALTLRSALEAHSQSG